MPHTRHKMRLALTPQPPADARWPMRAVAAEDATLLGPLMYVAYHGTIDDEGETPEECDAEMRRTLDGAYGPLLADCSFIIEERGRALATALVTLYDGSPLLAFAMTRPEAQGRGMGGDLILASASALFAAGHSELILYVTEGNAAQRLYTRLGFVVVDSRTFEDA